MKTFYTKKHHTIFKDVFEISLDYFEDSRGQLWTTYNSSELGSLLPSELQFNHDKFSISKQNVLRGIHGDKKSWKLVTCVYGEIYQVIVDLRKDSETYRKWQAFTINELQKKAILIPPMFGNAFLVKSSQAVYHYKLAYDGEYVDAHQQFTIPWNDPDLSIEWPIKSPILSDRDK